MPVTGIGNKKEMSLVEKLKFYIGISEMFLKSSGGTLNYAIKLCCSGIQVGYRNLEDIKDVECQNSGFPPHPTFGENRARRHSSDPR